MKSPFAAADVIEEKKKETIETFKSQLCTDQPWNGARFVGYDVGIDMISKEGTSILSVTKTAKDCQGQQPQ